MKDGANKLVAAIGETISTVPKIYDDVIQPSAQEVGRFAARVPRAINAAFSNLDKWIANREYSVEETKKILAKKLEKIDDKKITTPELYVAVPAIQAISYSMDSEEVFQVTKYRILFYKQIFLLFHLAVLKLYLYLWRIYLEII